MLNNLPYTHFYPDTETVTAGGLIMCRVFQRDTCETCGEPTEGPNAVQMDYTSILHLKLIAQFEQLPEIGYNDETGKCDCDNCA